ncbi:MAG: hypothetical protein AAF235_06540 [Planctomycetota bacterium]
MPENQSFAWLPYALLTVSCFGSYGVLLHTGQIAMGDPANGRFKAFLWVGIAYFLVAVLAPLAILIFKGAGFDMPGKGVFWSLAAGIAGAVGAFGILLAFGAKGQPAVVMSIVFAGAPIVNAIIATSIHPPAGGLGSIDPRFYGGIVLAAVGGLLVTLYKPPPAQKAKPAAAAVAPDAAAADAPSINEQGRPD